jgi:hypothetical protein
MVASDPHRQPVVSEQPVVSDQPDPRRQVLVESLRNRYRSAAADDDAEAKQALFKEAVYLGIQPEEFTEHC